MEFKDSRGFEGAFFIVVIAIAIGVILNNITWY